MRNLVLSVLFITISCLATPKEVEQAGERFTNLVVNPGAENKTAGWSVTGGTLVSTTSEKAKGLRALEFDASSSGQKMEQKVDLVVPDYLADNSNKCIGRTWCRSTDANYQFDVENAAGTNLESVSIPDTSGVWTKFETGAFTCGSAGLNAVIESTANGAVIQCDEFHISESLIDTSITRSARFTMSGNCLTAFEDTDWISGDGSRPGTGRCDISFNANSFSDKAICVVSAESPTGGGVQFCRISGTPVATATAVLCLNPHTSVDVDEDFQLICHGPR